MRALLVLIANAKGKNENLPLWSTRVERSRDLCPASMGMIIDPETSEVLATSEFACPKQEALNGNSCFCDAPSREFHPLGAFLFSFLPRDRCREFNPCTIPLYFKWNLCEGHAAMRCIEILAKKQLAQRLDRESGKKDNAEVERAAIEEGALCSSTSDADIVASRPGAKMVDTNVPYLANGYDYYTTVEPCIMFVAGFQPI